MRPFSTFITQLAWVTDVNKRNTSEELARSVAEADDLLEGHMERKVRELQRIAKQVSPCNAHCRKR